MDVREQIVQNASRRVCSKQPTLLKTWRLWLESIAITVLLMSCKVSYPYVDPHATAIFQCFDELHDDDTLIIISYGILQVNDSTYTIYRLKYNSHYLIAEVYDCESRWWRIQTDYMMVRFQTLTHTKKGSPLWSTIRELPIKDRELKL